MDQDLDDLLGLARQGLRQLQLLPQSITAVASSSLFIPQTLREALHDIAILSGEALQQIEQAVDRLIPHVTNAKVTAKKLEDVVAEYSVKLADTRAENACLTKLAAIRLITYAFRNALQHHKRRKQEDVVFPTGHVAVVCTTVHDLQSIRHHNNRLANEALGLLGPAVRRALRLYHGVEYDYDGDGGFVLVFHTPHEAVRWCAVAQAALQRLAWPADLAELAASGTELDPDGRVVFTGLRVQMGVCTGKAHLKHNLTTGQVEYSPALLNKAHTITKLALPGEILVLEDAYEEVMRQPLTHVPMAGIAWFHRKEYAIVEGEPRLLRTALPSELMNRRRLYVRDGQEDASPLVAVVGEEWTPLNAPHQREELARRQITKLQGSALVDNFKNVDVLAVLKKNAKFLDVIKQLMAASGLLVDLRSEDPIAALGRATASLRKMRIRVEVLQAVACDQIRHQREERRRTSEAIESEVRRRIEEGRSTGPPPSAHAAVGTAADRPRQRSSGGDTANEPSPWDAAVQSDSDVNPSSIEPVSSPPLAPRGPRRRSEFLEESAPMALLGRQVSAGVAVRDVKRAKGGGEEEWVYSSLELFSFAKDHPAAAAEEGGEDDDVEGADTNSCATDQEGEEPDAVVLEKMVATYAENPTQYLTQSGETGGPGAGAATTGHQMLRNLSKRGSGARPPPASLSDIIGRITASQGSAFGSSVKVEFRPRSSSTSSRRPSGPSGPDLRSLSNVSGPGRKVSVPGLPARPRPDAAARPDRGARPSLGTVGPPTLHPHRPPEIEIPQDGDAPGPASKPGTPLGPRLQRLASVAGGSLLELAPVAALPVTSSDLLRPVGNVPRPKSPARVPPSVDMMLSPTGRQTTLGTLSPPNRSPPTEKPHPSAAPTRTPPRGKK
eukprot:EG_transcript_2067